MSQKSKWEYLKAIYTRYRKSSGATIFTIFSVRWCDGEAKSIGVKELFRFQVKRRAFGYELENLTIGVRLHPASATTIAEDDGKRQKNKIP